MLQWIYSKDFSGGGLIFGLLVVGEGLQMVHAIFGTALTAAGEARKAAIITVVSLLPALGTLVLLILGWGATGAALSNALTILISSVILAFLAWRRFGALMHKRSVRNIVLAGCVMLLTFVLLNNFDLFFLIPCAGGLTAYLIALIASGEITREDFALLPGFRMPAKAITR
jgi:O-antigen/teichoic acid export membrane protein